MLTIDTQVNFIQSLVKAVDQKGAQIFLRRARTAIAAGNYAQAIMLLTKAIGLDPYLAAAYYNRGLAKALQINGVKNEGVRKGGNISAIRDYQAALSINPKSAEAHYQIGLATAILENYREAIKFFTAAIELYDDYLEAYMARGYAMLGIYEEPGAQADFAHAQGLLLWK